MKLLVFGRTGQVARELQRLRPDAVYLDRSEADLADLQRCARAIETSDADAVINAAAWTAVDKAEAEEPQAQQVNALAPEAMAKACAVRRIPFLHISTDYVFDGSGTTPWRSDDLPSPVSAYGRTKLSGENSIRAAGGTYAILRTSWVFSAHGSNFVRTMLRLGAGQPQINVVADQFGGPTSAHAIASALLRMADVLTTTPGAAGTYHLSGAPDVSWAEFAREIFRQAGLPVTVSDIPTTAYPTPARRPLNSRLDCSSLAARFDIARPDWREDLTDVLEELGSKPS